MIPGVVASQQRRRLDSEFLPDGAIAYLEFTTDRYWAGGEAKGIESVLSGFDPASISSRGMNVGQPDAITSATNWPVAAGAFESDILTYLGTGITLVFELDVEDAIDQKVQGPICIMFNNADPDTATDWWWLESSASSGEGVDLLDDNLILVDNAQDVFNFTGGTQIVACVISRDAGGGNFDYLANANGYATPVQDTAAYNGDNVAVATIRLFGVEEWDFAMDGPVYVRSITLYPAVTDGDLVALTTA